MRRSDGDDYDNDQQQQQNKRPLLCHPPPPFKPLLVLTSSHYEPVQFTTVAAAATTASSMMELLLSRKVTTITNNPKLHHFFILHAIHSDRLDTTTTAAAAATAQTHRTVVMLLTMFAMIVRNTAGCFDRRYISKKYLFLKYICDNPFLTADDKDRLLDRFCLVHRTYFVLHRFLRHVRKRIHFTRMFDRFVYNTQDLLDTPFDFNASSSSCLSVFEDQKWYSFTRQEIFNFTNSALTYHTDFFSAPFPVRNPYTNIEFRKSTLYNFYFFVKTSSSSAMPLFDAFFQSEFDLVNFEESNQFTLRSCALRNFVDSSPSHELAPYVLEMLQDNIYTRSYCTHRFIERLGAAKLVTALRPYLHLHMSHKYSLDTTHARHCYYDLQRRLKNFYLHNPHFGEEVQPVVPQFKPRQQQRTALQSPILRRGRSSDRHNNNNVFSFLSTTTNRDFTFVCPTFIEVTRPQLYNDTYLPFCHSTALFAPEQLFVAVGAAANRTTSNRTISNRTTAANRQQQRQAMIIASSPTTTPPPLSSSSRQRQPPSATQPSRRRILHVPAYRHVLFTEQEDGEVTETTEDDDAEAAAAVAEEDNDDEEEEEDDPPPLLLPPSMESTHTFFHYDEDDETYITNHAV